MTRPRIGALLALGAVSHLAAAEWPQFRGPHARGVDDGRALPTRWNVDTGENIRWQTPVPGLAHASPVVWGDRVYVATAATKGEAELKVGLYGDIAPVEERDRHQWRLLALDKTTGRILWNTLGHEAIPKAKRHRLFRRQDRRGPLQREAGRHARGFHGVARV